MSKISIPSLLEEPPIVVYPSLAKALGINQAAVFQQLHYLLTATKTGKNKYNLVNGKWWVYNTYEEWQEYFSWLSESAIKQMFLALEKRGLVVSQQGLKKATDRRKWYTIDYDAWETFRKSIGQNLSDDETKSVPSMNGQNLSDVYTNIRDTTKPLSPATQDDSETLPTTVKSKKQAKPPTPRLLKRDVSAQLVPVLFKYGKGRTLESFSQSEVTTIMKNQFTPLLKALQPLDDEHPIDAMELDAAYKWFRKQHKDASYPCGAKTVATMLANYRAYKRSLQVSKPHIATPAIDGLLAQPAPTYAESIDITDVRIMGETE